VDAASCAAPTECRKCAPTEFAQERAFLRGSTATTTSRSMDARSTHSLIQVCGASFDSISVSWALATCCVASMRESNCVR